MIMNFTKPRYEVRTDDNNVHYINEYKTDKTSGITFRDTILESDNIEVLETIVDQLNSGILTRYE